MAAAGERLLGAILPVVRANAVQLGSCADDTVLVEIAKLDADLELITRRSKLGGIAGDRRFSAHAAVVLLPTLC